MSIKFNTTDKAKRLTGTKRKTCCLDAYLGATPIALRSGWDGGSRSDYSVVNVLTGVRSNPPTNSNYAFDRAPKVEYTPAPGDVLIKTGTFCGKPSYPSFSCAEADLDAVKRFLGIASVADSKTPHSDESGDARFVRQSTVMDDCGTGGVSGAYMTPKEEKEYNAGMARLAELG